MPAGWNGNAATWSERIQNSQHDARLSAFGECVVRTSPNLAWALLRTDVASKAEAGAFKEITPTLARCLATDRGLQLGKYNVRGTVALNFYRLAAVSAGAHRSLEAAK